MTDTSASPGRYDLFISYSRKPDYRLARDLESFLESFHRQIETDDRHRLRELRICRDGGDFRLSAADGADGELSSVIRPYLDHSDKLLVLCSANAATAPWVEQEIEWFLKTHDPKAVILAMTEGDPAKDDPAKLYPSAIVKHGIHKKAWYDFRGARAKKDHPYQDFDEARVRLAKDLNGPLAGDLWPLWKQQQEAARRRRRWIAAGVTMVVALLLVVAGFAIRNSAQSRRESAARAAEDLANRAEALAEPGPRMDVVRAFHLAVRAALVSPEDDTRTPLHVARVFHIAATLPVKVIRLRNQQHNLQRAIISRDGRHLLAMDQAFRVGVWELGNGTPRPLPFPADTQVGEPGDAATGGPGVGAEFLEINRSGTLAKAVTGGDTLWVWEIATGRVLQSKNVNYDERPFFAEDGLTIINKPPPEETPLDEETREPALIYRGRRPVHINAPDQRYSGQYRVAAGTQWAGFGTWDGDLLYAVTPNGWVYGWSRDANLLVRKLPASGSAAQLAATGDSVWMIRDRRIVHARLDSTEIWSGRIATHTTKDTDHERLWPTTDPSTYIVTYDFEDEKEPGRLELWREGESVPRTMNLGSAFAPILEVVLKPSGDEGLVRFDGEEEYDYVHGWRLDGKSSFPSRSVLFGVYVGLTRDGGCLIERHGSEVRLIDLRASPPVAQSPLLASFPTSESSASTEALISFLKDAYDVRATADGITATLRGGRRLALRRAAAGTRLEIGDRVVQTGGVGERDHRIDLEGRFVASQLDHGSSGGIVGSGRDIVIREASSGRALAGHLRHYGILGFTTGGRSLITSGLREAFVHGGHTRAPAWMEDLPVALTGTRMSESSALEEVSVEERQRVWARVAAEVRKAAEGGDTGAAFLLRHFFERR